MIKRNGISFWPGTAAALALLALVAAPLPALAGTGDEALSNETSWLERLVDSILDRNGLDRRPAVGNENRRSKRGLERHHLTIEPGGEALPPPADESEGPVPAG